MGEGGNTEWEVAGEGEKPRETLNSRRQTEGCGKGAGEVGIKEGAR